MMKPQAEFPRSDAESLELTAVSRIHHIDSDFDLGKEIEKFRDVWGGVKPEGYWVLVAEEMRPRSTSVIIPVKQRYTQYKGKVLAVGSKVTEVCVGDYIMWGLYNGKKTVVATGFHTWFILEKNVLAVISKDCVLTD